jgi:hypothetical protein
MNFIPLDTKNVNKKALLLFIIFMIIAAGIVFAANVVTANQLSEITKNKPSKVAKMSEAIRKMSEACRLARNKNYEQAMRILDEITVKSDFDYEGERYARITQIETMVLKGDYKKAYEIASKLNSERLLNDDYMAFIKALRDFEETKEPRYLLSCIDQYNKRNQNVIPPKVYDLTYLSRTVRLLEMAGEIDRALDLTEQYFSKKSLKFYNSPKTREGFTLLKEALLRDKREGKNIYAQELINTTDYFGLV